MCHEDCYNDLVDLLHKYGLPYTTRYRADDISRTVLLDKKRRGDKMTLVFPRRIGKCILFDIDVGDMEQVFALGLHSSGERL
jgi:3-dehydroquinate synthetase